MKEIPVAGAAGRSGRAVCSAPASRYRAVAFDRFEDEVFLIGPRTPLAPDCRSGPNGEETLMKQAVSGRDVAPAKGPYSPGLRVGDFVFVSGQVPTDPGTGEVTGETIEEQTRRTLENVRAVLEAAGAGMDDCVKVTVHLQDIGEFGRFNEVYAGFFKDPKPTRTTVQSGLSGIRVEIDAIAYSPRET